MKKVKSVILKTLTKVGENELLTRVTSGGVTGYENSCK